jgi:hypothetical protein
MPSAAATDTSYFGAQDFQPHLSPFSFALSLAVAAALQLHNKQRLSNTAEVDLFLSFSLGAVGPLWVNPSLAIPGHSAICYEIISALYTRLTI